MKAIDSGEINIRLGFPKHPRRLGVTEQNLGQTHSWCSPASAGACHVTDGSAEGVRGRDTLSGYQSQPFRL